MSISDKRHTIKLETLTPVHIGSGAFLQNNVEFVKDNKDIYIIDPKKILEIIGIDKLDYWVGAIDRGDDITQVISRLGKKSTPDKYAKRSLKLYDNVDLEARTTLKECMHNGRGIAYIPGSSIKGAIRTAIFADIAYGDEELGNMIKFDKGPYSCSLVEGKLFGESANNNVFRFIHIGDAYFSTGCEIALNEVNLNIRESHTKLLDKDKKQLIEAIGKGCEAEFSIKIQSEYNAFAHSKTAKENESKKIIKELPENCLSIEKLFETINSNTQKLVSDEIEIWKDIMLQYDNDTTAQAYILSLNEILNVVNNCDKKQCVLRVGHASGWRFMTGAWVEPIEEIFEKVISISRANAKNYEQYDFPKTRRIGEGSNNILGFVKLTIAE